MRPLEYTTGANVTTSIALATRRNVYQLGRYEQPPIRQRDANIISTIYIISRRWPNRLRCPYVTPYHCCLVWDMISTHPDISRTHQSQRFDTVPARVYTLQGGQCLLIRQICRPKQSRRACHAADVGTTDMDEKKGSIT